MSVPWYALGPEQTMKEKADYARKGVARGRSIVALEIPAGILLVAENPSTTLHKLSEIYDRIAFAGVGKYNEFDALRQGGIRIAEVRGYQYGRADVTGRSLATAYAQTLGNIFTHEHKPYEVEILVAEVSSPGRDNELYRVTYDGTVMDEHEHAAIGGQSEALENRLKERYADNLEPGAAIQLVMDVFADVELRPITAASLEVAILEREGRRRAFRRIGKDRLTELVHDVEPPAPATTS